MIEDKEYLWDNVEEQQLAKRIRWKPVISGFASREGYLLLYAAGIDSRKMLHFVADYVQHKLQSMARVRVIENFAVLVDFDRESEIAARKLLYSLIEISKFRKVYSNSVSAVKSFLPKNENDREETMIIHPTSLCDINKFFSAIQEIAWLYGKTFGVFSDLYCPRSGSQRDTATEDAIDDFYARFNKSDKIGSMLISVFDVQPFLKGVLEMYSTPGIDYHRPFFIMEGEDFSLEMNEEAVIEIRGDLSKVLRFFSDDGGGNDVLRGNTRELQEGFHQRAKGKTILRTLNAVARRVAKKAPHVRDAAAIVRKERR